MRQRKNTEHYQCGECENSKKKLKAFSVLSLYLLEFEAPWAAIEVKQIHCHYFCGYAVIQRE
jgi:hypothetical protein